MLTHGRGIILAEPLHLEHWTHSGSGCDPALLILALHCTIARSHCLIMLSAEANIELYSLEESISVPDCTTRIDYIA